MSSIARKGFLRAIVNQKVESLPVGHTEVYATHIELSGYTMKVVKAPATSGKDKPDGATDRFFRTGSIVQISTEASIKIMDRVMFVVLPEELHQVGLVSGPSTIMGSSEATPITFNVQLFKDYDFGNLAPIKLLVEGE